MGLLLFFVILCIFFEVYARYSTYKNFTHKYHQKVEQVQYTTWNPDKSEWEHTQLKDLREGQIIMVERYSLCQKGTSKATRASTPPPFSL